MTSIPIVPESQFTGPEKKRRRSRKLRKNYTVTVERPRTAKGKYPKGKGLNKRLHVERPPIIGDRVFDKGPLLDPRHDRYLKEA